MMAKRTITNYTNPSHKTPKDGVELARSFPTKRERDAGYMKLFLAHVHIDGHIRVASDGFRLHMGQNTTGEAGCKVCKDNHYTYPDYHVVIPTKFDHYAIVDATELRVIASKIGFTKDEDGKYPEKLKLTFENYNLKVSTVNGETNERTNYLSDGGLSGDFGISGRFLIDAIDHVAPEGGQIEIKLSKPNSPIMVRKMDGHENEFAIIMPIYLP